VNGCTIEEKDGELIGSLAGTPPQKNFNEEGKLN